MNEELSKLYEKKNMITEHTDVRVYVNGFIYMKNGIKNGKI